MSDTDNSDDDEQRWLPNSTELFEETHEEVMRRSNAFAVQELVRKREKWATIGKEFRLRDSRGSIKVSEIAGDQQHTVWACSVVLSRYLELRRDLIVDKKVVELGCGIGLPGLTACKLGAGSVVLTERRGAIDALKECIVVNFGSESRINACALEWDLPVWSAVLQAPCDVILCSDLVYAGDSETTCALVDVINKLTAGCEEAVIVSCFEVRAVGLLNGGNSSKKQEELFTSLLKDVAGFSNVESITGFDPQAKDPMIFINLHTR